MGEEGEIVIEGDTITVFAPTAKAGAKAGTQEEDRDRN